MCKKNVGFWFWILYTQIISLVDVFSQYNDSGNSVQPETTCPASYSRNVAHTEKNDTVWLTIHFIFSANVTQDGIALNDFYVAIDVVRKLK